MGPHNTHSTAPARFPRILIAENNFDTSEQLVHTIVRDRQVDCDFDVCTSRDRALRKLVDLPYHLIISGVHLAEMDDFFLLKQIKQHETFVPFVVAAGVSDKESVRHALWKGAFDLIPTPLNHEQTVFTIRLALWHGKLMGLIASQEKALDTWRQHIVEYPGNKAGNEAFSKAMAAVEKTVGAVERTIRHIEDSIRCMADLAAEVKQQTLQRAFERLITQQAPAPHDSSR